MCYSTDMSIRCGKCRDRHETTAQVRACYAQAAPAAAPAPARREPATEGMYVVGGTIYKVQRAVHGSGRLYAKRLEEDGTWEIIPGMIRNLSQADRMTLEAAKAYGALYGRCVRCQADLTDEKSIAAGIGPICATKV